VPAGNNDLYNGRFSVLTLLITDKLFTFIWQQQKQQQMDRDSRVYFIIEVIFTGFRCDFLLQCKTTTGINKICRKQG
jgi:hypothetical protein